MLQERPNLKTCHQETGTSTTSNPNILEQFKCQWHPNQHSQEAMLMLDGKAIFFRKEFDIHWHPGGQLYQQTSSTSLCNVLFFIHTVDFPTFLPCDVKQSTMQGVFEDPLGDFYRHPQ